MLGKKQDGRHFKTFYLIIFAFILVFALSFFALRKMNGKQNFFEYLAYSGEAAKHNEPKNKVHHIKTPNPVKGIYMTSWVASVANLRESLVDLIDKTELNAVVIDVKDYTGRISFDVSDSVLKQIGSSDGRIKDIKGFINRLHSKNIYVIARIAAFQDPFLVAQRPDLAVKKSDGKTVWKEYKGAVWLDQCSKEVWDYIAAIGKEAEAVGFDELNFDYIRFPSDGNMKDIKNKFCDSSVSKSDSLENFFFYLKSELADLDIPLSADLFGMVTVNEDDLNIGQILEKAEPYFNYISPMVYPSHYPKGYNGYANPADHPYEIIKLGMDTASRRLIAASSTSSKLRPWLQDFNLGATYDVDMVRKQKRAVYDAGLTSWLLWSPSNKYTAGALDK